jgi:hypothetical protein
MRSTSDAHESRSSPEARIEAVEQRLEGVESRLRIEELVSGYCQGLDRDDPGLFISIWHDNAIYIPPGDRGEFVGAASLHGYLEMVRTSWASTHHWCTSLDITFDGVDRAKGRSDAFAICKDHHGGTVLISATYHDDYRRDRQIWKIARRTVEQHFKYDIGQMP